MADENTNPVIGLDKVSMFLEDYVRPYVEISLLREMIEFREKGPSKKEVGAIKREIKKEISDEFPRMDKKLKDELKADLYGLVNAEIGTPDEEEITHHSQMAGQIMASSWVEYLRLALKQEKELPLNKHLLPKDLATIRPRLQEAYDMNLGQLLIRREDVTSIMERLAQTLFEGRNRIDLLWGISIEKAQEGYVAKRH